MKSGRDGFPYAEESELESLFQNCVVRLADPEGYVSTGFLVSDEGHILTCWHVVREVRGGAVRDLGPLTASYKGEEFPMETLLLAPESDIAVLRVRLEDLERLRAKGFASPPLRLPWGDTSGRPPLSSPVVMYGFQRQDVLAAPIPLRALAPAEEPYLVRCEHGLGEQRCMPFICSVVHTDKGMSGAPLLNLQTGYVEGIVSGVAVENLAERDLRLHGQEIGFAVPLDDVARVWPGFVGTCHVLPHAPLDEVYPQGAEFTRHGPPSGLIPRQRWIQYAKGFLTDPVRSNGYLVLIASPGAGKSSFTVQYLLSGKTTPIYYFLDRGVPHYRDPTRMLLSLTQQLWMRFGQPVNQQKEVDLIGRIQADQNAAFRAAETLSETLEHVSADIRGTRERVVLWIDGVDEAFGSTALDPEAPQLSQLLPQTLPDGIFIVLTSRPGHHLDGFSGSRVVERRVVDAEDIDRQENIADVRSFIDEWDAERGPGLEEALANAVARKAAGNFLVAYLILQGFARPGGRVWSPDELPTGLKDAYEGMLGDILARARKAKIDDRDVQTTLGMVALAGEPLTIEQLQLLDAPEPAEQVLALAASLFRPRPSHRAPGLPFEFTHATAQEALAARITKPEIICIHVALAGGCTAWRKFRHEPIRAYALRHRFNHLIAAGQWEEVASVFGEADFIVEMARACGFHEVHGAAYKALKAPALSEEWKRAFVEWEWFLGSRMDFLRNCPDEYPQETLNEFLPFASAPWQEALEPIKKARPRRGRLLLRKAFGPAATPSSGHTGAILCVAWSPDGRYVASGSDDQRVKIWRAETGRLVADCRGHRDEVQAVAFAPSGSYVASGSRNSEVRVWECPSGHLVISSQLAITYTEETGPNELASRTFHRPVAAIAFSADGQRVAACDWHGRDVFVLDMMTGSQIATSNDEEFWLCRETNLSLTHPRLHGHHRARSQDGRLWVNPYGLVRAKDGRVVRLHRTGGREHLGNVAFSPDGSMVVTGGRGEGEGVDLWDARTGHHVARCNDSSHTARGDLPENVAFSPDGRLVAACGEQGLWVWAAIRCHSSSDHEAPKIAACDEPHAQCLAFSPDGRSVACGTSSGRIAIWRVASEDRCEWPLAKCTAAADGCAPPHVQHASFSPDGAYIVSGTWTRDVRVWNTETADLNVELRGWEESGPPPLFGGVAISPRGQHVAATSSFFSEWFLTVWETATGRRVIDHCSSSLCSSFHRQQQPVFSSDGGLVAAVLEVAMIWEVGTGRLLAKLGRRSGHAEGRVIGVAISPDGRRVATINSRRTLSVWMIEDGRLLTKCSALRKLATKAVFSPDGRLVATMGDGRNVGAAKGMDTVLVIEAATGRIVANLPGHSSAVLAVAFSPDGRLLASAGRDGSVKLWNVTDWRLMSDCRGHDGPVRRVVFSPHGQYVASTGDDCTARLWQSSTGKPVGSLSFDGPAAVAAFVEKPARLILFDRFERMFAYDLPADVNDES